jgi:hypothetical protein
LLVRRDIRGDVDLDDHIAAFFQLIFHYCGLGPVRDHDDTRFVGTSRMPVQDLRSHEEAPILLATISDSIKLATWQRASGNATRVEKSGAAQGNFTTH